MIFYMESVGKNIVNIKSLAGDDYVTSNKVAEYIKEKLRVISEGNREQEKYECWKIWFGQYLWQRENS